LRTELFPSQLIGISDKPIIDHFQDMENNSTQFSEDKPKQKRGSKTLQVEEISTTNAITDSSDNQNDLDRHTSKSDLCWEKKYLKDNWKKSQRLTFGRLSGDDDKISKGDKRA
jgi:hypothetical protein